MRVSLYFKIRKVAKENGFRGARYLKKWQNYKVYGLYISLTKVSYIGLPQLILSDGKKVRMATPNEVEKILFDQ